MWTRRLSEAAVLAAVVLASAVDARGDPPPAQTPSASEDPLAPYRERFKQGMDRYKEGSLADAIGYWQPIYVELGEAKGYRLAYNLGVAYAELGDATRAGERLQSFLDQVQTRRASGAPIEDIVAKEEGDSKTRLASLVATRGRIRIDAGPRPCAAQVDAGEQRLAGYVAWVSPGHHTVTFAPGTAEASSRSVDVDAGDLVTLLPPVPPAPSSAPPSMGLPATTMEPPRVMRSETVHPFSPAVLAVGGVLALGAGIVAIPLESSAWSERNQDIARRQQSGAISSGDRQSYADARTQAYAAIGASVGLAAVTAGLAAWYLLGAQRREVVATSSGVAWSF